MLNRSKSSLNIVRIPSENGKKSIEQKKEDFKDRVQKLKNKLTATKKYASQREYPNMKYNQTASFFNSGIDSCFRDFSIDNDGSISPPNLRNTSACGNYSTNFARSNAAGFSSNDCNMSQGLISLPNNMHPHIVISNNDMNRVQNLSYYSTVGHGQKVSHTK